MPNSLQSPRSEKLLTLLLALALLPSCSREPGPSASGPQVVTAALADAPASPATPPSPQPDPAPPAPAPIEEGVRLILATEKPEPTTTFELRFDSPVASPDQVGEPTAESPLRIEPPLKGTWTWLSTRSGVFVPEEPLGMARRYTLSLGPLQSPDGAPVAARLTRQIQTPGLEVLTRPSQAETNATARPQFAIHFNADVDPAAFEHPILLIDGQAAFGRQRGADFLIARHDEFLAPPVETKVARAPFWARSHNNRPRVAQPDVAERLNQDADPGVDESRSNLRLSLVIDDQPHFLAAAAVVDNVGKSSDIGTRRIDLPRPLVIEVRKADPHCGVRRPFGGHGERHGRRLAYLPSRDLSRAARNSSPSFQLGQLSVDASIRPAA